MGSMARERNEKKKMKKMNTKHFPILSVWPKPSEMDIFVASSAKWDWFIPNQSSYKKA
jgi:hypothetical protein